MTAGLRWLALVPVSLCLAACGSGTADAPDAVTTAEAMAAAPDAPEGIAIADGRLLLPAVAGNPGAVYFTIANTGENDRVIAGVHVEGAGSAMLHMSMETDGRSTMQHMAEVPVPRDGEVAFAPGGLHVMAMDLGETLAVGGTAEVTLTFVGGDKASFPAEIRGPGDDS